jgi:DNA-binding CsgD family transcriptional regulator
MRVSSNVAIDPEAHLYPHFPHRQPPLSWFFRISSHREGRLPAITESTNTGIAMKHIRQSKVIDRDAPELVDLFDHLRDTLIGRHGITKARYVHLAPSADGLSLKVAASPLLRPLAVDFVENRRHELLYDLAERMRRPEPTRFVTGGGASAKGIPEPLRAARQQYGAQINKFIGEGWWHGFDVPTFGPCGRRGLFLINAPLEQPLTSAYVTAVRRELQDFHVAYCAVDLAEQQQPPLAAEERELLCGLASGMRMAALAAELGLTTRGTEDRLKRVRAKLGSKTTAEAVAKAVAMGLIL